MPPDTPEDILARAHAAVASLKEGYREHLRGDMETLRDAALRLEEAAEAGTEGADALQDLFATSHNMKGQAGTFGYELITEVSEILSEFLRARPPLDEATLERVRMLVDTLGTLVDQDIEGAGGALGQKLLDRLRQLAA